MTALHNSVVCSVISQIRLRRICSRFWGTPPQSFDLCK